MEHAEKTQQELIDETVQLRSRIAALEDLQRESPACERALRASEARYRRLFESAKDGILILAADSGQIQDANPFLTDMLGYSWEELLGKELWEIGLFQDIGASKAAFAVLQREGYIRYEDLPLQSSRGRVTNVEFVSNVYLVDGEKVIQCNIRDITQRKRAQQALDEERALLRMLIDNIPDGIYFKDAESRFVRINQALARRLGLREPDQAVGKTDFDFFAGAYARSALADEQAIMRTGEPLVGKEEKEMQRDGPIAWVSTTKMPRFDPAGRIVGTFGVSRDITERKQAEEQLRLHRDHLEELVQARTTELAQAAVHLQAANVRLQELDRLKSEFVSNVSHELRSPLTNIKLYLSLLESGKPGKSHQYMTTLKREVDLLYRLIEDLLNLSSLDLEKVQPALAVVDVNRLVHALLAQRASLVAERGLVLRIETEPALLPVLAHALRLTQVLTNLMTNAMNYTPAGGVITVRTAARVAHGRTWATFSVSDTGPGMTPDEQAHVFERFYRGEAARATGASGTGLGLAISHTIMQRHRGMITVESQLGHGSTFVVWLPTSPDGLPATPTD